VVEQPLPRDTRDDVIDFFGTGRLAKELYGAAEIDVVEEVE
jgi:hypothetical protein